MAVRIEILDYNYSVNPVGQNMIGNYSFTDTSCWSLNGTWLNGGISGGMAHSVPTATVGYGNIQSTCLSTSFEIGVSYRVEYRITGKTQGNLYLLFRKDDGSCADQLLPSTDGTHVYDFKQANCNLTNFGFFVNGNFDGSIKYVKCRRLSGIDWDKSMVGELEITDHSDFPLALTLQIGNIQDITSTSGDYSKTFKVPATKNNNKLLKHIYNPKVVLQNNAAKYKPCRIVIDGMQSLTGLIKVVGMEGRGENASLYNCVFYGNNMSWAKGLEEAYLNTLELPNSKGLSYNKTGVIDTWQHEDSDSASPIVYPVVSYGDFNPDGKDFTIQLLDHKEDAYNTGGTQALGYFGWFENGSEYPTPKPTSDWRPAVFVKTTLEQIFKMAGNYTISSQFMDTDMFKKLVWLLPNFQYNNPDDRYNDLGIEAEWQNLSVLTVPATTYITTPLSTDGVVEDFKDISTTNGDYAYTGAGRNVLDIGATKNLNVTLDNGSYFDMGNDYITVGEYGNYDIILEGLQVRIARAYHDSTSTENLYQVGTTVNVEVRTVGQTSWNIIAQSEKALEPTQQGYPSGTTSTNRSIPLYTQHFRDIEAIDLKAIFLNKGDRIRFTTGLRVNSSSPGSPNFKIYCWWRARYRASLRISIDPSGVYWGQTYDLDKVIDPKYKQIDFIKGVAHAFNLVMTTNSEDKVVYIEPFNDFYQTPSNAVDWTSKLDRSREISDKWMPSELKRNFVFKYKTDDNDEKVKYRKRLFDDIEDEYPYRETLSDEFDKGDSIFENPFFAGTFNGQDRDTNDDRIEVYSPCLWQDKGDGLQTSVNDWARPDKGYDFKPRLLYWNKLEDLDQASTFVNYAAKVQVWESSDLRYLNANKNYPSGDVPNIYPQATSVDKNNALKPVLTYGNVWVRNYDAVNDTYSSNEIGKGLYETYYRGLFEMLKQSPRLRTVYVDLKVKDIVNLNFAKLIYIDGCYWRIGRVVDYKPNGNTPTKVELVEWIETGVHALHPPSYGISGGVSRWGTSQAEELGWWGNWDA